jgi:two-component system response regulator AlgR
MRLLIVDDEPLARERLRRMVEELPGWEVAGEAANGEQALSLIRAEQPDVVLLDIHMAGMDGLQVAHALAKQPTPPAIIFVTAYSEHALSAFETSAVGYLLKPVRKEKLSEALARARRPSRAQLETLVTTAGQAMPRRTWITATTRDGTVRVPVMDIVYFLADRKYTTVHHLHGEVLIEESLNSLEEDLAPAFMRVHRKALVQVRFIERIERGLGLQYQLKLRHADTLLPVGRRRLAELRRLLTDDSPTS